MRLIALSITLVAGLAVAGCDSVTATSGPPVAGTATGPGSAPLQQQSRDTMGGNSANASSGTANLTGARTSGDGGVKPEVNYTGTAPTAGVGGDTVKSATPPSRANKGGS